MQDSTDKLTQRTSRRSWWAWGCLLLIVSFVTFVRCRALNTPLERDEGEYAYIGSLILDGVPPYKLAYAMKLPGTYVVYALAMAMFGKTAAGVHLGLLCANLVAIVFVFLIARRLFDELSGVVAAAFYAVMTLGPALYGASAHANHFVVLFALPGLFLLQRAIESDRGGAYFASGVLFGLAFLMKQHGAVFGAFAVLYLIWIKPRAGWQERRRQLGPFIAGAAIPYVATCLVLLAAGVFQEFWFWTVTSSRDYVSTNTPSQGWQLLVRYFRDHARSILPLWTFAMASAVIVCARRSPARLLIGALLVFSALGVSIGYYFRPHYFILLMPVLALAVGGAVALLAAQSAMRRAYVALFFSLCVVVLTPQARLLFRATPEAISRAQYGSDFFVRTAEAGEYLRQVSPADARIAVLGSEPQICFYAKRRSATGFIYMYDLMAARPSARELQEQLIREVESQAPEFGVLVIAPHSWLATPESETLILGWASDFFAKYYRPIGVIDFVSDGPTVFVRGDDAAAYVPRGKEKIFLFQRRESALAGKM